EAAEGQAFFKWLEALAEGGTGGEGGLDEALLEQLFGKMCALEPAALDATACSLFLRFFARHNERAGKLRAERSRKEGGLYYAVAGDVGGLRHLWLVALEARDDRV